MLVLPVALAVIGQMATTDLKALRKYRYGLSAAQIETMGLDAYEKIFDAKTPDHDAGVFRGVAYGVYVDAYRENTGRRYRAALPPSVQSRRLAIDRQMRLIGVLFARNDWLFTGGNAVDPEADDLKFAQAERQLYSINSEPDERLLRSQIAAYHKAILAKSLHETLYGAPGPAANGRQKLQVNLRKLDLATDRAAKLCRTPNERAALFGFVASQASMAR